MLAWQTRRRALDLSWHGAIMGILNVTPDSFSDGGSFIDPDRACMHALAMADEGADIIDVGGESTRPGAEPVPEAYELARVLPVIERIRGASDVLISIDTCKARVAEAALAAGADIINDVTALTGDPAMPRVARDSGAGVVLMHMRGTPRTMQIDPRYGDVVAEVRIFLRQQFDAAVASGIDPARMAMDPGIGFGKMPEHNHLLLGHCDAFSIDGRPVLIGASRKSFLAGPAGSENPADRFWPGVALTSLCRERGARIFRVHEPRPHREALRMTEAILYGV
ncbi:MAG: dihydropteroate synthase [Terrimicrobiaceae bacterium]|nr:dihydropteroate synthase [Terrimicrobiaceae bacterium]